MANRRYVITLDVELNEESKSPRLWWWNEMLDLDFFGDVLHNVTVEEV